MKNALIVHNPTAGDSLSEKDELLRLVEIADFKPHYISTEDEGWKNFSLLNADVLVVAGGDGTVRKLAKTLLKKHKSELHIPIAVVPLGTANNIAKTLKSDAGAAASIDLDRYRNYDTARVKGLDEHDVMLESLGFGAFPQLMHDMKNDKVDNEPAKEKIRRAQGKLVDLLHHYKPFNARIEADGKRIEGTYLMVELMNIKSFGPSLHLAPHADAGDGYFDLVLVKAKDREAITAYVQELYDGKSPDYEGKPSFETRRVKNLRIALEGVMAHVDDELIHDLSTVDSQIEMQANTFKFLDFRKEKEE
jgi:diacylglycerol kinase (ATP)